MGVGENVAAGAGTGAMFGPWGAAIGAGIGALGSIFGAKESASGQEKAAQTTQDTAKYAADLQKQASDAALAFAQQQAAQQQSNFIAAQNANYNQWLYRQGIARPYQAQGIGAIDMLGGLLGVHPADLPALPAAPNFATSSAPSPSAPSGSVPTVGSTFDPTKAKAAWDIAYPGRPFPEQAWQNYWPGLVARGQQLGDPLYAEKRLMGYEAGGNDIALAGPFAGSMASTAAPSGLASLFNPFAVTASNLAVPFQSLYG